MVLVVQGIDSGSTACFSQCVCLVNADRPDATYKLLHPEEKNFPVIYAILASDILVVNVKRHRIQTLS